MEHKYIGRDYAPQFDEQPRESLGQATFTQGLFISAGLLLATAVFVLLFGAP